MIPALVLSPRLQRRQREEYCSKHLPILSAGLNGDVGLRSALIAIVPIPIPYGWSEKVGRTLFYQFKEAPDDLLSWAQSDEVATIQERNTGHPYYIVVAIPGSQNIYKYGSVMQHINRLYIGVVTSGSVELHHAFLSAMWSKNKETAYKT